MRTDIKIKLFASDKDVEDNFGVHRNFEFADDKFQQNCDCTDMSPYDIDIATVKVGDITLELSTTCDRWNVYLIVHNAGQPVEAINATIESKEWNSKQSVLMYLIDVLGYYENNLQLKAEPTNKYSLYGTNLINNDDTLEEFCKSVIENVPEDDIAELKRKYGDDYDDRYEEEFMKRVEEILEHDISRTNIDYEELMLKYAGEIGQLLYDYENHGGSIENLHLTFFGERAKESFNRLATEKIWFIKFW